jgi:TetR/AcrR family transcriptional regulator
VRVSRIRAKNAPISEIGPKAERTRSAILAAAEGQFARHGYVATRLEDVAAAVGVKRAALFYHFADKQRLYDAVIASAFHPLAARLEEAFSVEGSPSVRLERAVEVWVETIVERPTLARLILRHAAEAEAHATQGLFPGTERLLRMAWASFEQGRASGEFQPVHDDPFHAASAVLGATVFYVAGFAALLPSADFSPLATEQVETHRRNALHTVRTLLGIRAPRSKSGGTARSARAMRHGKSAQKTRAKRSARAK